MQTLLSSSGRGRIVDTTSFLSKGVRCQAWHLPARSDQLRSAAGRPCLVMVSGLLYVGFRPKLQAA